MRLPLDRERVRAALRAREIRLGPSLWALLGGTPSRWPGPDAYPRTPRPAVAAAAPVGLAAPATRTVTGRGQVEARQLSLF